MGWGSKSYYSGGTIRAGLFGKESLPNPFSGAILSSILNGADIVPALLAVHNNGYSNNVDRLLRYGRDTYQYGLPEGDTEFPQISTGTIQATIEAEVGEPINILFAEIDDNHVDFVGIHYIQKTYGFDAENNTVLSPINGNSNAEIDDISYQPPYIEIKLRHSPTFKTEAVIVGYEGRYKAIYAYVKVPVFKYMYIRIPAHPITETIYICEYELLSDPGKSKFWSYVPSKGTYPSLAAPAKLKRESQYYPIIPIIANTRVLTKSSNPELHKQTTKMLDYVNLSIEDIIKQLRKNEDFEDLNEVFVTFSLDIKTTDNTSQEYLYRWFRREVEVDLADYEELENYSSYIKNRLTASVAGGLIQAQSKEFSTYNFFSWPGEGHGIPPTRQIVIKDREFNVVIKYRGYDRYLVNGSIGSVGTTIMTRQIRAPKFFRYRDPDAQFGGRYSGGNPKYFIEASGVTFKHQITEDHYEVLTVIGLEHDTTVFGRRNIAVNATLSNSNMFYIPLNYDILESFNGVDESKILFEATSLIIYWIHRERAGNFFTSTFFKVLVFAATVYFGGFDLSSLSTMTTTEIVTAAAIEISKQLAFSYALKQLAELGGIFAVIAAVYAAYKFGYYEASIADGATMPWAKDLLDAVTMIANARLEDVQVGFAELQQELSDFTKSKAERNEELEDAYDLLDNGINIFDPLYIMNRTMFFNPDETPSAFFNRSLNTNPGVASLDYIGAYHSLETALPTFNGLN